MLSISDLKVVYDEELVLENVNLDVDKGIRCCILGKTGLGKTSILKSIANLIHFDGSITYMGEKVDPKKNNIGYIPQNHGLLPWKSCEDNIKLPFKIGGRKLDEKFFDELVEKLEIKEILNKYPSEISGGQSQRVSICRAFLTKPEILLMDEPFSALDEETRNRIQDLFLDIWEITKPTTVFITHSVNEGLKLGQQIVELDYHIDSKSTILRTRQNHEE